MSGRLLSLDRMAAHRTDQEWLRARSIDPEVRLVPVWRSQSLLQVAGDSGQGLFLQASQAPALLPMVKDWILLGATEGHSYFAVDVSKMDNPLAELGLEGRGAFSDLRAALPLLSEHDIRLLAYARGVTHWQITHRFCGICGSPTESQESGHMRLCTNPACATRHFPRTDPVVIMLVLSEDHCLLGRQAAWAKGRVSALAGFVEPGETLEEAVAREVMEEAGVPVVSAAYFTSQTWPFPTSLMCGFIAQAEGRPEPHVDGNELEHAAWYSRAEVAELARDPSRLPGPVAIARWMVDYWLST